VIGVIDTEGDCVEWTFSAEPGAVRAARSAVRGRLHDWGLDCLADIAALLVSELVTNALLVEVSDPIPDFPRERIAAPEDESGRGLQLVAHSSRRWGTRPGGAGKTVWFELAVP
jgi:hypothetical protein